VPSRPGIWTSRSSRIALARRQPDERLRRVGGLADDDGARLGAFRDEDPHPHPREFLVVDDEDAQRRIEGRIGQGLRRISTHSGTTI
jgi:hypothetical protein